MTGIVIVGASHAGLRAAVSARDAGYAGRISIIDQDPDFPPYERPPLSKWADGQINAVPIISEERLKDSDLTFITAAVQSIDPDAQSVALKNGDAVPYEKLLVATGARARPFEIEGIGQVQTLRNKSDAEAILQRAKTAKSALIIGAGFIGLELAASLRGLGLSVCVSEVGPRILGRGVSSAVADIVGQLHVQSGVEFELGATVTADKVKVFDLVVAGIGSLAVTELAEAAGLTVQNGIQTDAYLRTSADNIFAAGDCCCTPLQGEERPHVRLESWTAAGTQGDIAGANMVSDQMQKVALTPWVWSNQYDHVLQVAGLPDPSQILIERSYAADHHITFGLTADGHLGFASGIAPGAKIAKDIRFAMKLMESGITVDADALANPAIALKSMLK